MSRRDFLSAAACAAGTAIAPQAVASSRRPVKPNIVFIFSDQQHWRACGHMDRFFDTPAQDALARESVVFETAICTTPQCSASRATLMTGLFPHRTGVIGNVPSGRPGEIRPLNQKTIGDHLQALGYHTAYFGKWHLGEEPAGRAGWNEHSEDREGDTATTKRALEFLAGREPGGKPFALFLSYINPHDIYKFDGKPAEKLVGLPASWSGERFEGKPSVHRQFMEEDQGSTVWGQPRDVWEGYRDFYRSKSRLYDDEVAKITGQLKARGLYGDAVIVKTSDHGDMDANHRLIFKGPFMYEHMVRVPLMVRLPDGMRGRSGVYEKAGVSLADLFPTLIELAGGRPPGTDGQSLVPALTGSGRPPERDFLISQYYNKQVWTNPIRMLRTADWKYNLYIHYGEELYDLRNDPDELVNLAGDPAREAVRKELRAELEKWIRDNDDPFFSYHCSTRDGRDIA